MTASGTEGSNRAIIRDARQDEVQPVLDIWREAYGTDDTHGGEDDVLRVIRDGERARLLVACIGDEIAGSLIVTFDGWRGHLYRLAVRPRSQRQGIATALLEQAESWFAGAGCTRVRATVVIDHPWATGFWTSAGYTPDSESYVLRLPRR